MSFGTGLSGIAAANKDLEVTGNNIANASTTGFKTSRTEFGDAYTNSFLGFGADKAGAGVRVSNIGQKFDQGNISQTNSALDLAVDGNGFFVMEYPNGSVTYTRSGIFGVDKEGYITGNTGAKLQGFGVNENGIVNGVLTDLEVDTGNQPPRGTHDVDSRVNVPAGAQVLQQDGTITRTNGLAIGSAQAGQIEDTRSTLTPLGSPTTAGTPAQLTGGLPRVNFPWQPSSTEASWTLDVTLQGPNINGGTQPLVETIQPLRDDVVYSDINDLINSINSTINANPELAGKIQATVNDFGGITFETAGAFATDGTSIVSVVDNVGTISGPNYLNFSDPTVVVQGNDAASLQVVSTSTPSILTSGRNVSSIGPEPFMVGDAGESLDFIASVGGINQTISLTVPSVVGGDPQDGYANYADLVTALDSAITDASVTFTSDRFEVTATNAGPENIVLTQLASTTSDIGLDELGLTSQSLFRPSLALGVDENDTIELDVTDSGGTSGPITLSLTAGTYANAESLANEINTQIANGPTALDGRVNAYAVDGVLHFDVLQNSAGASLTVTSADNALAYYGLDAPTSINSPTTISPVEGNPLFADGGFIDLTSDPGAPTTIQANTVAELEYNNLVPGTFTSVTSSNSLNSLDNAGDFGDADAGRNIDFSVTINGITQSVTLGVPLPDGYNSQTQFATAVQAGINNAFSGTLGNDVVTTSIDSSSRLTITASDDLGAGPSSIAINHIVGSNPATVVNMATLGMSVNNVPNPTTVLGTPDVPPNNELQVSIDNGPVQTIVIPAGTYDNTDDLVDQVNALISTNPTLSGEIQASQINGRLIFERTDVGGFPLDIEITGSDEALEATGLISASKSLGEEPIDRSHSFRVNLSVPLPDEDQRSGSVLISLDEVIFNIDQLASAINRELSSVPEEDYVGVRAVVGQDETGNDVLVFEATEDGEASQVSITNIRAPGDDLDVNALFALLQTNQFDTQLLELGGAAITNGYPEQSLLLRNEDTEEQTPITIPEGSSAANIAAMLSEYQGVDASAETEVRLSAENYRNSGAMDVFINGQVIEADDFASMVEEMNQYQQSTLNSLTAELDSETGDIIITSSTGIDITVGIESTSITDSIVVQGAQGTAPVTLGGNADAETDARIGGFVDIILNDGYTMTDPDPRVTGMFNGLTPASFEDYTINAFNPDDTSTYNEVASLPIYDSIGNQHQLQLFYVKNPGDENRPNALNSWTVYAQIDGEDVGDPDTSLPFPENTEPSMASFQLFFNPDGTVDEENTGEFLISNWSPIDPETGEPTGAYVGLPEAQGGRLPIPDPNTNSNMAISFDGTTQYGGPFARYNFQQDGYASGRLQDLEIGDDGVVFARYTNGEAQVLGQVALASFANNEGLDPVGNTEWKESFASGDATVGEPGTGLLGSLQSAALEDSTVDLSEQLVHLIIAQRNYQASAKTIETANAVTQTIINLR